VWVRGAVLTAVRGGSYSSLRLRTREMTLGLEGCWPVNLVVLVVIGVAMTAASNVREVKTIWKV
jgi:hypothetical protein